MDEAAIHLPSDLRNELERRIEGTDFDSVEAYATFVLRAVVEDAEDAGDAAPDDDADHDELEDRLEDLGYL